MKNKLSSWESVRKELFTPEEIIESNIRVSLVGEIITTRKELGLTQKQIEELSGVKQPIIARMEKGTTDPQLSTILKVLNSLGKTLQIVDLNNRPRV